MLSKKPREQPQRPAHPDSPAAIRLKNIIAHLIAAKSVTSQYDFGNKIGYNESYLSQLVNGSVPISLRVAKRIYETFGVDMDYLLEGKGVGFVTITEKVVPTALFTQDKNITHISEEFLGAFYRDEMNLIYEAGKAIEKWSYPGLPTNDKFYSLYVNDDKMTGIYSAGTLVVLHELFNVSLCIPGKNYYFT